MTPREVDARIAELAGWSVEEDHHGKFWVDTEGHWVAAFDEPITFPVSAALEAAEKLARDRGMEFALCYNIGAWVATFNGEHHGHGEAADSPGHPAAAAICAAILAVLDAKEDRDGK